MFSFLLVGPKGPTEKHHHHLAKDEKKLLWWTIPIVLLIKLYFIKVALHTILFGVVVLKLLVFKGALWLPYLAYEVKRVCLKEGILKEVWNGLWQKRMDLQSLDNQNLLRYTYNDVEANPGYNDSFHIDGV